MPKPSSKRYLVTGGAGFIGSHLVDFLIASGHQVTVLDDFSTGKEENLNEKAELVRGDIADEKLVNSLMSKMEGCFHLAAIASVQQANQNWLGTHHTNLTGTITILNAARAQNSRPPIPVVYASSAAIYGDYYPQPLQEPAKTNPLTAYGADKYACELHAFVAAHVHNIPTIGLRFFNVYGPRQDPRSPYSGVISIFFDCVMHNQNITIYGTGNQSRDFIYVSDVVAHLSGAMQNLEINSMPTASVFNVCTGISTTINDLASLVLKINGKSNPIEYTVKRQGDIQQSLGDPQLAVETLQVKARISLTDGLQRLYESLS